jgi:hypothetical protein
MFVKYNIYSSADILYLMPQSFILVATGYRIVQDFWELNQKS